jgi:integrase
MSVHQLKDGRWMVRHAPGKDPERPTTNKKYFGRGDEARRAATDFDALLHGEGRHRKNAPSSPLFYDLVVEYLQAKRLTMTPVNWRLTSDKMTTIILPVFVQTMAHEITPAAIDHYAQARVTKDGVKRTTVHREISDIRAVLRWAVKRRLIAGNPMDGYEMPKRDDARLSPPTEAEFRAILAKAAPHLQRAMLITYHTGLRPGREELLCLRWESVDFINRTLMVVSAQKGGLPRRMVPLNEEIFDHLQKWFEEDDHNGAGYIVHYHGAQINRLKTAWEAAKKRATVLRRIRLYDLRHAFATRLLGRGANLKAVSEILGHASPDMTMRVYQHVDDDLRRQAVDLMMVGATVPNEIDRQPQ